MDLDQPDLTDPRPGESVEAFEARVSMIRRAGPMLAQLAERGFSIVVEAERRTRSVETLETDFVIEYGDSRVRVLFCPQQTAPLDSELSLDELAHYFLDAPDTDAVAVVADDDSLSTCVVDVYDVHSVSPIIFRREALASALARYFSDNVFAVELPDFRSVLALPSGEELKLRLETELRASFETVARAKARIPEKMAALESLGPEDSRRLLRELARVLDRQAPSIDVLLGDGAGDAL